MVNKKGSLNLSIQAIVIVVIAFVVLGLGLGFVRSQFADIQKTSTAVQEQISQQILEELRTGNKPLSFPASELKLDTGAESVQAIGIKNTDDEEHTFEIRFQVKESGGSFQDFENDVDLDFASKTGEATASIIWDDEPQTLREGKTNVVPVTIKAPSKQGTFLYKVILYNIDAEEDFATKTFFIKTT